MLSTETLNASLEAAAADLKKLSYEELERYAVSHGLVDEWQSHEMVVDGHIVHVNTMMGKLGWIHKRMCVELTLSVADPEALPADTRFEYFERYKSGRFYPSPREEARDAALIKALPPMFLGVVAIVLLVVAWYFFLRGG